MRKYILFMVPAVLLVIFTLASFVRGIKSGPAVRKENAHKVNFIPKSALNRPLLASEFEKRAASQTVKLDASFRKEILQNISELPLTFEKNMGQWQKEVLYRANSQIAKVGFRKNGLTFFSVKEIEEDHYQIKHEDKEEEELYESMVWNLNFNGMNTETEIVAEGEVTGVTHYLLGNDSAKWIRNTPQSKLIKYKEIYDHIDLHYYGLANKKLEYDYIVKPGGDIASIKMGLEGAGELTINNKGQLIITTPWGKVAEEKPFSYQFINGIKKEIDIRYKILDDSTFGFQAYEGYDKNYELVIDPKQLVWSTYVNGNDITNYVYDLAIDGSRNSYITGYTGGSFYITAGVKQSAYGGGSLDAFVCKFNRTGTSLLYCTYLGGSNDEKGFGIAASSGGNAYITGTTGSSDFPMLNALDATANGTDAFISALNPTGTGFIYSTYFGGGGTDWGKCVVVNAANEIYVTGIGRSNSTTSFPTTAGVIRTNAMADATSDAFVVKLTSTGTNAFCTLFGLTGTEEGNGIFVSGTGEIYITGETNKADFPVSAGCYDNTFGGSTDAFVAKLNATATAVVYSTFLGGGGADVGEGIYVRNDEAYVVGRTGNNTFPFTAGAFQTAHGGSTTDNFVTKFNTTGTALVYSTYLGGSGTESQNDGTRESDIVVNNKGEAYVSGVTTSANFPVVAGSYDVTQNGGDDGYISLLSADGGSLLCSTFFGGDANDYKRTSIALDFAGGKTDTIYASITTHSSSSFDASPGTFPIAQTQGTVYSKNHVNGGEDEPAVFKMYSCVISALPVELMLFKGTNQGDNNLLEWSTTTEKNNDYFSVERSRDGVNFLEIGTVDGSGSSNSMLRYSYSDPRDGEEITYYRLKQTDFNGQVSYSKVVGINSPDVNKALKLTITSPVSDYLNYRVCCLEKGSAQVEVIDLSGKIIIRANVQVNEGNNKLLLDAKDLPDGLYILKFTADHSTVKAKFVK